MKYPWTHVLIGAIISYVAFVVAGFWEPLPFGLQPSDAFMAGGLFYFAKEAVTSQLEDVEGWTYPLAVSVVATIAGRVLL